MRDTYMLPPMPLTHPRYRVNDPAPPLDWMDDFVWEPVEKKLDQNDLASEPEVSPRVAALRERIANGLPLWEGGDA